jgi:RNA polymerase sigma factor (sigma-70 family)
MNTDTASWMEQAMGDAAWTRRLAGALLGDPGAADDALQEVWLKTEGAVDGAVGDRRGWLRTVVANSLRDRRRSERRRQARERTVPAPAAGLSPEELVGKLEVHRVLVALLAELAEPARQVVLLHYFEGVPLVEIARITGAPAGTVRWRLKTALEELRGRLDRRYGEEKRDWRAMLAPLLPMAAGAPAPGANPARSPDAPAGESRPGPQRGVWLAVITSVAVVVLLSSLALRSSRRRSEEREALAAPVPAAPGGPAGRGRGPGGTRPVALAAAAVAAPCPEQIAARTRDLEAARHALAYHLSPQAVWTDASEAANPAARAALWPLVQRALDERGAPVLGRTFECKATACLATVVEEWPPTPPWVHKKVSEATDRALAARARVMTLDGPARRARPDGSVGAETKLWLRLNDPGGAPADAVAPSLPPAILPSGRLARDEGNDRARTEECRARLAELDRGADDLRRQALRYVTGAVLYANEAPDGSLTARLQAELDRKLASAGVKLAVDCHGPVCQLAPRPGERPPGDAVKEAVVGLADGWDLERVDFSTRNGRFERAGYLVLVPRPGDGRDGEVLLKAFAAKLMHDPHMNGCRERLPATGALTIHFMLPAAGQPNDDGVQGRISFRLSGPGADTPFAACLREQLAAAVARVTLPDGVRGGEMSKTIDLTSQ